MYSQINGDTDGEDEWLLRRDVDGSTESEGRTLIDIRKLKSAIPITFTFDNVIYSVEQPSRLPNEKKEENNLSHKIRNLLNHKKETKTILHGVSGVVKPGQILALMGPSGSGKTTLLDVLSGRANRGKLDERSRILVNGRDRTKYFRKMSGYVMQDDALMGTLTVREALETTALLRLPKTMPKSEKMHRVELVLTELGLTRIANNLIGSQFQRGVSGGERKRVAIGIELITAPSLIFVDEPTSGLDGASALSVIATLHRLAQNNRTIICSIHQPRSSVFTLFDSLLLLSGGQTVYFGSVASCSNYFSSFGYNCPQFTNYADFLLDLVNTQDSIEYEMISDQKIVSKHELQKMIEYYNDSPQKQETLQQISELNHNNTIIDNTNNGKQQLTAFNYKGESVSQFYQFWILLQRALIHVWRSPEVFWIRLFQGIFMALLVGSIFFDLKSTNSMSGIQKRSSALFFICVYQSLASMPALAVLIEERGRFNRERVAGFYSTGAYFAAISVAQIPIILVSSLAFCTIAYWMIGLQPHLTNYLVFLAVMLTVSLVADSICMLASSMASQFSVANAICTLILAFFLLFGGFFIKKEDTPVYWKWANSISFFKYAFEGILENEFHHLTFACPPSDINPLTGVCVLPTEGSDILVKTLGLKNPLSIMNDVFVLFGMFVVFRILIFICLRFFNKERR